MTLALTLGKFGVPTPTKIPKYGDHVSALKFITSPGFNGNQLTPS